MTVESANTGYVLLTLACCIVPLVAAGIGWYLRGRVRGAQTK